MRTFALAIMLVVCVTLLTSCKKVDKTKVAVAVATLKQADAGFSASASGLTASDANDQKGLTRWVASFQTSLDQESLGVGALQEALNHESHITSQTAEALQASATDASLNAASFKLMMAKCTLTDAQKAWSESTQNTLNNIATQLLSISNDVNAPKVSPAPAPATKPGSDNHRPRRRFDGCGGGTWPASATLAVVN